MTVKVGINRLSHIGCNFTRAALAQDADIKIVMINNLTDNKTLAHLFRYDSILGKLDKDVTYTEDSTMVGGRTIKTLEECDPAKFPWGKLGVNIVVESTGRFTNVIAAKAHLDTGAKRVIISAPARNEDATFVIDASEQDYNPESHDTISNAPYTTNCLAPLAKVPNDKSGIVRGLVTTIHTYTIGQNLQDGPHKDLRRVRVVALNIVPTKIDATQAVALALPGLKGKLDGHALRVPTPTGSVTNLTFEAEEPVIVESISATVKAVAEDSSRGILTYTENPVVLKDIETDLHSSIFDSGLTKVIGNQVEVVSWYDNEWGYSNCLVDLVKLVGSKLWRQ